MKKNRGSQRRTLISAKCREERCLNISQKRSIHMFNWHKVTQDEVALCEFVIPLGSYANCSTIASQPLIRETINKGQASEWVLTKQPQSGWTGFSCHATNVSHVSLRFRGTENTKNATRILCSLWKGHWKVDLREFLHISKHLFQYMSLHMEPPKSQVELVKCFIFQ